MQNTLLYAIVSTDIRRDLVAPIQNFTKVSVLHLFRTAPYNDLAAEDWTLDLSRYKTPWQLFLRLVRAHPDLIQGVEPFAVRLLPYLYGTYFAALWLRIPLIIVTLENRPLHEKYGGLLAYTMRLLLRPILTYARLIIYLNAGAFRNLQWAKVDTHKLQRLMYGTWGVNLSEFTPRQVDQESTEQATRTILYVGRLHQEKGVFDLLHAFDKVSEQRADTRLVLIGDGPDREAIVSQINNHSWHRSVFLVGTVKNRDLPAHFQAADVFVAPSIATKRWEEQVGMTNIQAMACGVPVVSTHSGAIPEYVPDGEAGILVPERDPEALAAAILRILGDDDLRAKLGQQGRAYAIKHYDARRNVMKAEQIILSRCLRNENLH